jgi:16S rRNA (guanine966-N2)-methyltransferase
MLKIIAGKHKNRIIPKVKNAKCRPSTSKFKEAVFSILTSGEFIDYNLFAGNTDVLDLFSGTGSYAFEAISRGARFATLIDINSDCLKLAQSFAELIGEKDNMNFLNLNALNLPRSKHFYDVIFIDPPYYHDFVSKSIESLIKGGWVNNEALIVAELGQRDDIYLQDNIYLITQRIYGNSKLLILQYRQE